MSQLELFVDEIDDYLYAAVLNNGSVVDLYINKPDITRNWASIYLGKVTKIDKKLDAAFVDLGNGLTGYLSAKHALIKTPKNTVPRSGIENMLKGGDMILVQIKAEGKAGSPNENHKLPRLTVNLNVPGGFLAYNPNYKAITFSASTNKKHIPEIETKIKNLPAGGWRVYPSVRRLPEEKVNFEAQYLLSTWQHILKQKEEMGSTPGLIKVGPISLFRALMDYGVLNFEHIYLGNKKIFNIMEAWCSRHIPALATSKRLKLFKPEKTGQKLFDIHDIYAEIEQASEKEVFLKCGGTIIIENTAAMTIIDVNQGSAQNINDANFEGAIEAARQIKIRNLSGMILIDFISVNKKSDREKIINILEKTLTHDIGSAQVHGFTRLGIIEVTRKRRTASLLEKLNKNIS